MTDTITRAAVRHLIVELDDKLFIPPKLFRALYTSIDELPPAPPQDPDIKTLGEELRIVRGGIVDEKVLIGFNMAVALCNKTLGGSEE